MQEDVMAQAPLGYYGQNDAWGKGGRSKHDMCSIHVATTGPIFHNFQTNVETANYNGKDFSPVSFTTVFAIRLDHQASSSVMIGQGGCWAVVTWKDSTLHPCSKSNLWFTLHLHRPKSVHVNTKVPNSLGLWYR
eukprot:scpid83278/ scgid29511/ 